MHIQYKIGLKQKSVPSISSSSYRPAIDFKISKTYQSLEVTSNEPYIGSGYIKTDQIISKYKYQRDYLIGEEPKTFINDLNKEFVLEEYPKYNIAKFLIKYRGFIKEVKNYVLDDTITENEALTLLEIKVDTSIHLLDKNLYTVDYLKSTVSLETPLEVSSKLFSVTFPVNYSYQKSSNKVLINLENILELTPGFYNISPKKVKDIYKIIKEDLFFKIENKKALKYISDFNISFDKSVGNEFLAPPSNSTLLEYSKNDISPLTDITSFDFSEGQEYIIYKLNGNKYDIAFKLPMHEKEQNLIDLLASHSEFKRPYSFIANKSKVIIKDYNDVVLESFLIINKDFKEIYNKPNNN